MRYITGKAECFGHGDGYVRWVEDTTSNWWVYADTDDAAKKIADELNRLCDLASGLHPAQTEEIHSNRRNRRQPQPAA
jgi:hypothetical protein